MSVRARIESTWRGLSRRKHLESEMDSEMRSHKAAFIEDQIRRGISRADAEQRAHVEFGSVESFKDECREARGLRFFDEFHQDLRYALRMIRKNPGFTVVAILTLALGIGANTSVFSMVNAWVLRPLPFSNSDQLLAVRSMNRKQGSVFPVSPADLYVWRSPNAFLEGIAGWTPASLASTTSGQPEEIDGARVNDDFFRLLRVSPVLGRDFTPEDDAPNAPGVALITDGFWRSHFGADRTITGRSITLNGRPVTVIGVLPAGFHFSLAGKPDIWMPLALPAEARQRHANSSLFTIARARDGVSVASARSFLVAEASYLEQAFPDSNTNRTVRVLTLRQEIAEDTQNDAVLIVFGLVGCVLLIACANVASLMFGRATGRQKEMALRLAIGANRFRLIRQLLTENVLLFVMGGGLGLFFAFFGVKWLGNAIPIEVRGELPEYGVLKLDLPVLAYTFATAVISGLIFGFAPAFNCSRVALNQTLNEAGSRGSSGLGGTRFRKFLVVFEMSLALVVLVASGLLVKSLIHSYSAPTGFQPENVITAKISLPRAKYSETARMQTFYEHVLARVRSLPRMKSAGVSQFVPFGNYNSYSSYLIEGRPAPRAGEVRTADFTAVFPGYLETMNIPLLSGRAFSNQDRADSQHVVIINRTLARREWRDADPLGQQLRLTASGIPMTIVGVVQDVKIISLQDPPEAQIYVPYAQSPAASAYIVARTEGNPNSLEAEIRAAVASEDKDQPAYDIQTMSNRIAVGNVANTIVAQATGFFALLSLFLAAIGIYGVVSYWAATRRQEIGIRMALGAQRSDVLWLVLGQGLRLTTAGIVLGLVASLAVTRLLGALLYNVSPTDISTLAGVSLVLGFVALLACYVPAHRAAAANPANVLRYE